MSATWWQVLAKFGVALLMGLGFWALIVWGIAAAGSAVSR